MPTLLIVTPYFPPCAASGSFRMLGFAKHLPKFGWDIIVVASGATPWESEDAGLLKSVPPQTEVHYVEFPLSEVRKPIPILLQKMRTKRCTDLWNRPALSRCEYLLESSMPDVVLTTGPPHSVHLIGKALNGKYGLPWVADFRDPWCSWGNEVPYTNKTFLLERFWERSVFRNASVVVANTENTAEMFRQVFPHAANRIAFVANGYDPLDITTLREQEQPNDRLELLHSGSIYANRDPRPIAEALEKISNKQGGSVRDPVLRLVGQCLDAELKADLKASGLERWVEFSNSVPYLEATKRMRSADLLVLLDSPGRTLGVPAKLYEYIGSQRPIIALAEHDSDTSLVLKRSGVPFSIVSDYRDVDRLVEAILALTVEASSREYDKNAAALNSMTREANAEKLSDILLGCRHA